MNIQMFDTFDTNDITQSVLSISGFAVADGGMPTSAQELMRAIDECNNLMGHLSAGDLCRIRGDATVCNLLSQGTLGVCCGIKFPGTVESLRPNSITVCSHSNGTRRLPI